MRNKILSLFWPQPVQDAEEEPQPEAPFATFKCSECGEQVELLGVIEPGQIAVVRCENCGTNWSFYAPQLVVTKVKDQQLLHPYLEQIAIGD